VVIGSFAAGISHVQAIILICIICAKFIIPFGIRVTSRIGVAIYRVTGVKYLFMKQLCRSKDSNKEGS
jgi:hypothetical protein